MQYALWESNTSRGTESCIGWALNKHYAMQILKGLMRQHTDAPFVIGEAIDQTVQPHDVTITITAKGSTLTYSAEKQT